MLHMVSRCHGQIHHIYQFARSWSRWLIIYELTRLVTFRKVAIVYWVYYIYNITYIKISNSIRWLKYVYLVKCFDILTEKFQQPSFIKNKNKIISFFLYDEEVLELNTIIFHMTYCQVHNISISYRIENECSQKKR